jgi:hypothetical protein
LIIGGDGTNVTVSDSLVVPQLTVPGENVESD